MQDKTREETFIVPSTQIMCLITSEIKVDDNCLFYLYLSFVSFNEQKNLKLLIACIYKSIYGVFELN